MPYPFTLPTTSSTLLPSYLTSPSHPSLPLTATTKRSILRDSLKKHKRLPQTSQPVHLQSVLEALLAYLPYLLALSRAAGYRDVGAERVEVEILKPLEVEWRTTLSATLPGREASRAKLTGLQHEVLFVLTTLGYTYTLLARAQLRSLHDSTAQTTEQRAQAIGQAMKHLLSAHGVHDYLATASPATQSQSQTTGGTTVKTPGPVDTSSTTLSALSSLALAEATLIVVSKDDPYAAAVAETRDEGNRDWMFKAPSIPKVRAHLYARISLAAAEHAGAAHGLLARGGGGGGGRVDEDLVRYAADLRATARGKACRFLGIDAELSGKTGEALAWLRAARNELGLPPVEVEDGKRKGFRGLKQTFLEKREDKKIATGSKEWGLDAGKFEEARVVEMLEQKWERENNAVGTQTVPAWEGLLGGLPSGREYHSPLPWEPPRLDKAALEGMRAPPEAEEGGYGYGGEEEDSGDEGAGAYVPAGVGTPGAFPGELGRAGTSNSYY